MGDTDLPLQTLMGYLQKLAEQSLSLGDLPAEASVRLINVLDTTTYLVEAPHGYKAVLRIHRENYRSLGAIAAGCHEHRISWLKPTHFERLNWNAESIFGPTPTGGNWRDAPLVDGEIRRFWKKLKIPFASVGLPLVKR